MTLCPVFMRIQNILNVFFLNVYLKKAGKAIFFTNCIQNIMMLHLKGDCIFFKEQVLIKWRKFL